MITETCLLLRRSDVPEWFLRGVERMQEETAASVSLIAVQRSEDGTTSSPEEDSDRTVQWTAPIKSALKRFLPKKCINLWQWAHRESVQPFPPWASNHRRIDILSTDIASGARIEAYEPADENGKTALPEETVELIASESDVVVQNSHGIITGDVLTEPEYGVLSFHHGDVRKYRGVPAGFWEFMHGESTVGITLQQLTEELDAGNIIEIKEVDVTAGMAWPDIIDQLYECSVPMLADGVEKLNRGYEPEPPEEVGDLYLRSEVTSKKTKLKYLFAEFERWFTGGR